MRTSSEASVPASGALARRKISVRSSHSSGVALSPPFEPARRAGDTVGSRKAQPVGQLPKRCLGVAAGEPGRDRAREVGITTTRQRRTLQPIDFRHRGDDPFRVQCGELSRLDDGRARETGTRLVCGWGGIGLPPFAGLGAEKRAVAPRSGIRTAQTLAPKSALKPPTGLRPEPPLARWAETCRFVSPCRFTLGVVSPLCFQAGFCIAALSAPATSPSRLLPHFVFKRVFATLGNEGRAAGVW